MKKRKGEKGRKGEERETEKGKIDWGRERMLKFEREKENSGKERVKLLNSSARISWV